MAALVACLAGCMGDSTSVPTSALSQIVLQPADVSGVFERFDEGRLALADQPEGRRAQPDRFGRDDGWKARYRRRGGAEVRGPLVIESRVDRFESSGGAEKELDAIAGEVAADVGDRGLGDEALVASSTQAGFPRKLRNVMVAWRSVNIVAVVTLSGFQGRLRDADALRLARLQQARIDAATG
jgi:hypothetical protein